MAGLGMRAVGQRASASLLAILVPGQEEKVGLDNARVAVLAG